MASTAYRYKVWLKQAEYDLAAARLSYTNGYYEWACFQAEQSAEKAIKAFMAFCGEKPPKVHKLSILLRMVRKLRPDVGQNMQIFSLQAFTFVSRYPFIIPGDNVTPHEFLTTVNAEECITECESMVNYIQSLIAK